MRRGFVDSSTRMLARYTHLSEERKIGAWTCQPWSQTGHKGTLPPTKPRQRPAEINKLLQEIGGRQGDRTPDLCIANAALSQLS